MAVSFLTGFECGHLGMFDLNQGANTQVQTVNVRNGQYAFRCGTDGAEFSLAGGADYSFRFGLFSDGTNASELLAVLNGATLETGLRITAGQFLEARRGSTVIATSATALGQNNWHLIEGRVKIAEAATPGIFKVRQDGTEVINFSGDTLNVAATWDRVRLGEGQTVHFIDDLRIDDTSGAYIGEGKVMPLLVEAAGDVTTLNGEVGSATHWQNVEERPPNDATDYNFDNAAVGTNNYDLYNLTAVSNVGSIGGIMTWVRAQKDDANTGNFRFVHKTGGNEFRDAADIALTQSWAYYRQLREQNPDTVAAWTAAELNALQAGFDAR